MHDALLYCCHVYTEIFGIKQYFNPVDLDRSNISQNLKVKI
jgi:hypothetical protein